jgi:tetratricopeptide (TPR) repeat protein
VGAKNLLRVFDDKPIFPPPFADRARTDWAYAMVDKALVGLLRRSEEALEDFDRVLALRPDEPLILGAKAQVLQSLRRRGEAIDLLRRALELAPQVAWLHAELGESFRLEGRFDDALAALGQALEIDPRNVFALTTRGQVLRALHRTDEAIAALKEALTINPDLDWARTELAEVLLFDAGRPAEALLGLEAVLERQPVNVRALTLAGRALRELGRLDNSEAHLSEAADRATDSAWVHTELGETLRLQGRTDEALQEVSRALTIKPDYVFALWTKAEIQWSQANADDALRLLDEALHLQPDYAPAWATKGQIHSSRREHDEALQALDRALELEPRQAVAWASKGQILQALGRLSDGMLAARRAVELNPREVQAHLTLGSILGDMEYPDEALDALDAVDPDLVRGPFQVECLGTRGEVLIAMGDFTTAEECLAQAVGLEPTRAWLRGLRAWALEHLSRAPEALTEYRAAAERSPTNWWWAKGIANALYLANDRKQAQEEYTKVARRVEEQAGSRSLDAEDIGLLGWCYYRMGEYSKALRHILQSLTLNPRFVAEQFDLALVLQALGREEAALREYEKGVEMIQTRPISRRYGLLRVALRDLDVARRDEEAKWAKAHAVVQDALSKVTSWLQQAARFPGHLTRAITINAPTSVVYYHVAQFERYPRFIEEVLEVKWDEKNELLSFRTKLGGEERAWHARVVEQVPQARLAYQSTTDEGYGYAVTLIPDASATYLMARLCFNPAKVPGDAATAQQNMVRGLEGLLNRFKQFVEAAYLERTRPS